MRVVLLVLCRRVCVPCVVGFRVEQLCAWSLTEAIVQELLMSSGQSEQDALSPMENPMSCALRPEGALKRSSKKHSQTTVASLVLSQMVARLPPAHKSTCESSGAHPAQKV